MFDTLNISPPFPGAGNLNNKAFVLLSKWYPLSLGKTGADDETCWTEDNAKDFSKPNNTMIKDSWPDTEKVLQNFTGAGAI